MNPTDLLETITAMFNPLVGGCEPSTAVDVHDSLTDPAVYFSENANLTIAQTRAALELLVAFDVLEARPDQNSVGVEVYNWAE